MAETADDPAPGRGPGSAVIRAAWAVLVLAAVTVLYQGRDVLVPVALAVLIWFLINASARALVRTPGVGPVIGLSVAKAIAAIGFIVLAVWAGRVIVDNLARITGHLDPQTSPIIAGLVAFMGRFVDPAEIGLDWLFELYPFDRIVGAALSQTRSMVSDAGLILLYVLFLLFDERFFDAKLRALVSDEARRAKVMDTISQVSHEARLYLWLMFLISLGVGFVTFVVCALFGVQGAAFWGFLAFGLNFIPTIGSILAVIIPGFYALLTLESFLPLVGMVLCLSATQFTAGGFILPRLMGEHLNLSSVVVLLSLVVWGALWGPVGMFLAIPITVIAVFLCARFPAARSIAIALSKDGKVPDG